MLRELHISNLAIIEDATLELSPGLNVFTGQTGAGKSLILGALELLLGLRGGGESAAMFVRPGCREARVSGVFEISDPELLRRLCETLDQDFSADEPLLITRRLSATGRSSASVNGSPVAAAMLRQAGELLVDIHGQHDQQFLLSPANQLAILDSFAGATETRRRFRELFRELREREQCLRDLQAAETQRREKRELYCFQAEEIDQADLAPGQYEEAKERYHRLKNAARLQTQAAEVLEGLSDGDESLLDRLGLLRQRLREMVRMDASLADLAETMQQAEELLHDAARGLARYQDRLEADPSELERTEARLDVLNRLIFKYARDAAPGDDPVAAVLAWREEIGCEMERLDSDTRTLETLQRRIEELRGELETVGRELTTLRRRAAERLAPRVEEHFADLEMPEASFLADLRTRRLDDPGLDATGLDEVEFLVRTNPGQEMLPLRKIASGGELSRILLAIRTVLAKDDPVDVLVFDEIDANIGDRLGAAIGRKMLALSRGGKRGRQVLCITHLSRIAACADRHVRISKEIVGSGEERRTVTRVCVLEGEPRVAELAEMMAGRNAGSAAVSHARELLLRRRELAAAGR